MNNSTLSPQTIFIIGAKSSFITEVIEICEQIGFAKIFCVDNLNKVGKKEIDGYPVIQIDKIPQNQQSAFVCCIHTPIYRKTLVENLNVKSFRPISIFHPTAVLSKRSFVSTKGVIIAARAVIGSHTTIGDFSVINRGALIGHDVEIYPFCTIESGVSLNGFCRIGEQSYIGAGAIVLPKVVIGKNCVVAAGAVVRENVADNSLVAGIPAIVKRKNISGYLGRV